jgi:hypothetical protein
MIISLTLLAIESSGVIALRAMKLMVGDVAAMHEARLMITEKVDAALEATASLIARASGDQIINRYQQHVAVNTKRLRANSELDLTAPRGILAHSTLSMERGTPRICSTNYGGNHRLWQRSLALVDRHSSFGFLHAPLIKRK